MATFQSTDTLQTLRLTSGLILFVFALTHLANHALALVSLELMHQVQEARLFMTRSLAITMLLSAALGLHILLGLIHLAGRASLNLPVWQRVQIISGLAIPLLLVPHIVDMRIAHELFAVDNTYLYALAHYWPAGALAKVGLVILVWTHACIGIHFWLRHSATYQTLWPVLAVVGVALPFMALAGFMVGGRSVVMSMTEPQVDMSVRQLTNWPKVEQREALEDYKFAAFLVFCGLLVLVACVVGIRHVVRIGAVKFPLSYLGGPQLRVASGPTLLEFSQMNGLPHAAECGGQGICGACRVRVDQGLGALPQPQGREKRMLDSMDAPQDVRLACRIRPTQAIRISRLVHPVAGANAIKADRGTANEDPDTTGVEKPLVILAVDICDFSELNNDRLACDKVFLLNEFIATVETQVNAHGGYVERVVGDGAIAVFGRGDGTDLGVQQALQTAVAIDRALKGLNAKLSAEIGSPIRLGMAIVSGTALVGQIGPPELCPRLSVVGELIAIAGRLESLNKDLKSHFIVPRSLITQAGLDPANGACATVEIRGIRGHLEVIAYRTATAIGDVKDLGTKPPPDPVRSGGTVRCLSIGTLMGTVLGSAMLFAPGQPARANEAAASLLKRSEKASARDAVSRILKSRGVMLDDSDRQATRGTVEKKQTADAAKKANPTNPSPVLQPAPNARVDIEIPMGAHGGLSDSKTQNLLAIVGTALSDPRLVDQRFLIIGHSARTDSPGTDLQQSSLNANAVRQFLIAETGLSPERLVARAQGASHPKYADRPSDVANRRVQIRNLVAVTPSRLPGAEAR